MGLVMAEQRKMIRFDDDEKDDTTQAEAPLSEDHIVMPHSCEEYTVREHNGFRFQKCGGGRRRLPKRSN